MAALAAAGFFGLLRHAHGKREHGTRVPVRLRGHVGRGYSSSAAGWTGFFTFFGRFKLA